MTKLDTIRLEMTILASVGVATIVEKMAEKRLRWDEHIERRLIDSMVRRIDPIERSQIARGRFRKSRKNIKISRLMILIEA